MKILFISDEGNTYPLASMMETEGHEIRFFTKDKTEQLAGDGFVEKTDDYKKEIDWCDYVICDYAGFGKECDEIRAKGKPVVGGTELSDLMEEDRAAGQAAFKAVGMDVAESQEFTNIDEAIRYAQENPAKYVVKVSGKAQDDKMSTYVGQSEDGIDIPPVLENMKKKSEIAVVNLQKCVEGVEIAIGGFFNGTDFLDPVCINFEHKKLMACRTSQAGLGPNTGEMGTVIRHMDKGFKLYEDTLQLFVPMLKKEGYHGYFDINCIIAYDMDQVSGAYTQKIVPLEMTNRFGWPMILLQMETMKINDLGDLFFGIANGKAKHFKTSYPYSCCVVIGVPPLPYDSDEIAEQSKGMPIIFKNGDTDGVYPGDAHLDEDDQWILTGGKGYACVACGGGDNVMDAQRMAYERAHNIIVANKMYREDIGDLVQNQLDSIRTFLEYKIKA